MIPVIAIDGPSGAGKGTICRLVASQLGYSLLDSGALYRLAALACRKLGVANDNEALVAEVASELDVSFEVGAEATSILLAGEKVSQQIREESVGMSASKIAAYPAVREALLERQKNFRVAPGLVADGRDMGTVVFPDASVKVFLTASAEERARRRIEQLKQAGTVGNYEQILSDIQARDEKDSSRTSAPLKPAEDALVLDSTALSIDEVFNCVMQEVANRIA